MRGELVEHTIVLSLGHFAHEVYHVSPVVVVIQNPEAHRTQREGGQHEVPPDVAHVLPHELPRTLHRPQELQHSIPCQHGERRNEQDEVISEEFSLPPDHQQRRNSPDHDQHVVSRPVSKQHVQRRCRGKQPEDEVLPQDRVMPGEECLDKEPPGEPRVERYVNEQRLIQVAQRVMNPEVVDEGKLNQNEARRQQEHPAADRFQA